MGNYDLFRTIAKSNLTAKEREVDQIKYDIYRDFYNSPSYESVLIDGINRDVQIVSDKKDNKNILSLPNETFSVGEIVTWNNNKFLITDVDEDQKVQTNGKITLCNNTISLYKNNILYQIPIVVESGVRLYMLGTEDNKYIETPSTTIVVRVSNNEITQLIKRNDVYKIGRQNWKVVDTNDILEPGILILKLEYYAGENITETVEDVVVPNPDKPKTLF